MIPEFNGDELASGLWVGACPSSPEFIETLRRQVGVTGIVSLQTDEDLRSLGLSWPLLWKFLMHQGITVKRIPIEDFSAKALARGLEEGVAAVHELRSAGHVTYVHCTAGINRSPTVAIAYMVAHGGLELEEAWRLAHEARPQIAPLRKALEAWLGRRKP